jgi:hypothetical protein
LIFIERKKEKKNDNSRTQRKEKICKPPRKVNDRPPSSQNLERGRFIETLISFWHKWLKMTEQQAIVTLVTHAIIIHQYE